MPLDFGHNFGVEIFQNMETMQTIELAAKGRKKMIAKARMANVRIYILHEYSKLLLKSAF